jgi:hypothetical protein
MKPLDRLRLKFFWTLEDCADNLSRKPFFGKLESRYPSSDLEDILWAEAQAKSNAKYGSFDDRLQKWVETSEFKETWVKLRELQRIEEVNAFTARYDFIEEEWGDVLRGLAKNDAVAYGVAGEDLEPGDAVSLENGVYHKVHNCTLCGKLKPEASYCLDEKCLGSYEHRGVVFI